jgi:hypothetical protein
MLWTVTTEAADRAVAAERTVVVVVVATVTTVFRK